MVRVNLWLVATLFGKKYIFKTVKKITHSFIQSVSHSFHGSLTLLFATLWLDEEKKRHIALETTDHQHDYIVSICYYKKRDIKTNYLGYICHFMDLFSTFSSIEYTYIHIFLIFIRSILTIHPSNQWTNQSFVNWKIL